MSKLKKLNRLNKSKTLNVALAVGLVASNLVSVVPAFAATPTTVSARTLSVASSKIGSSSATFDKYKPKDIVVKLTLNGNTLDAITNDTDDSELELDTDYTISEDEKTVTISQEYLDQLENGRVKLNFDFSGGTDRVLTVTVKNTAPSAKISPASTSFDKNKPKDIAVKVTPNGNTLDAITNVTDDSELELDTDYTVSEDQKKVTISADYFALKGLGTLKLNFDYSGGTDPVLSVQVKDTAPASKISPTSTIFDNNKSKPVVVRVTPAKGNTLDEITNGENALELDTDYTVSEDQKTVTITEDYLATLENGVYPLVFNFSAGADPTFKLTVKNAKPVDPQVAIVAAAEEAIKAYEDAAIVTPENVVTAEALGVTAQTKVDLVTDADVKADFEARIAAKKELIDAAKAEFSDVENANAAVTALETAAEADLTDESNLLAAEEAVTAANVALENVDAGAVKDALQERVTAATMTVTDARAAFDLAVLENAATEAVVALEAATADLSTQELIDAANEAVALAEDAIAALPEGNPNIATLTDRVTAAKDAIAVAQEVLSQGTIVKAAEDAVAAYVAAPITTVADVTAAEALEVTARTAVNLVVNTDTKAALVAKIDAKKVLVDAAKAEFSDIDIATAAVTALETAAKADLKDESNLLAAEAAVTAANVALGNVEAGTVKDALQGRVTAATKIVTDARAAFDLAVKEDTATKAVVALEAATADLSTQALIDAANAKVAPAEDAIKALPEGNVNIATLTARVTAAKDAIAKAQAKLSLPVIASVSAINETTVQVTFATGATVTEAALVGKTIKLTAGDKVLTATYKAETLAAGTAKFVLAAADKLIDATTYTASSDSFTFTTASFMAKIATPYASTFEKSTANIPAVYDANGVAVETTANVYLTAKNQYGEVIKASDATYANIKAVVSYNGMPLLSSEYKKSNADDGKVMFAITKVLKESDKINISLTKYDKDFANTDAKVMATSSIDYTVIKGAAAVPTSLEAISAEYASSVNGHKLGEAATEVLPTDQIKLTAGLKDQYGNPVTISANVIVRWVVTAGKDLVTGNLADGTEDTKINTVILTAAKPGTFTVEAYNIANGAKASYTVTIGQSKLTTVNVVTFTGAKTKYNQEDIISEAIGYNDGAKLTPDMLKFEVTSVPEGATKADVTINAAYGTKDDPATADIDETKLIYVTVKTAKAGEYKFVPYVGTSYTDATTVKAAQTTITSTLNPYAVTIDTLTIPTIKIGTPYTTALVVRNKHQEIIPVKASDLKLDVFKDSVKVDPFATGLDKDGNVAAGDTAVAKIKLNPTVAGDYTVRATIADTVAMLNVPVTALASSLVSIDLGEAITDNSIIANGDKAVYRVITAKDSQGDKILPDTKTTPWEVVVTDDAKKDYAGFASVVYFKTVDSKITDVDKKDDAEGIALKFVPNAESVKALAVDTKLNVKVDTKVKDVTAKTLDVTVKAVGKVNSISVPDQTVTLIKNGTVKKEIIVKNQYGIAWTDAASLKAVSSNLTKATAAITYDATDKKMYVTYTGVNESESAVTITISTVDNKYSQSVSATVLGSSAIGSIEFKPYSYSVYANPVNNGVAKLEYVVKDTNGNVINLPANDLLVSNDKVVKVVDNAEPYFLKISAKVFDATTGYDQVDVGNSSNKDALVPVTVVTANGKTATINLTFSDDSSRIIALALDSKTMDEDAAKDGVQVNIGLDSDGNKADEVSANVKVDGIDQYGMKNDQTDKLTWNSSDAQVAGMAGTKVVAYSKAGTANVSGILNGKTVNFDVTVTADAAKAVATAALAAVNAAANPVAMRTALEGKTLGLNLMDYAALKDHQKDNVATSLVNQKPFADKAAVQKAFDKAVSDNLAGLILAAQIQNAFGTYATVESVGTELTAIIKDGSGSKKLIDAVNITTLINASLIPSSVKIGATEIKDITISNVLAKAVEIKAALAIATGVKDPDSITLGDLSKAGKITIVKDGVTYTLLAK